MRLECFNEGINLFLILFPSRCRKSALKIVFLDYKSCIHFYQDSIIKNLYLNIKWLISKNSHGYSIKILKLSYTSEINWVKINVIWVDFCIFACDHTIIRYIWFIYIYIYAVIYRLFCLYCPATIVFLFLLFLLTETLQKLIWVTNKGSYIKCLYNCFGFSLFVSLWILFTWSNKNICTDLNWSF